MSSILTNNAAMTALQTLKGINNNLQTTQSQISTGKKIASAKDNAAIWAISKTMEADVEGFKSISDTLGLGDSQVGVAKNAAESTTDLLKEIKGKIVDAQADGTDPKKIQTDIDQLRNQIETVVGSAQFNGVNLTQKAQEGEQSQPSQVLSSLNRQPDGTVEQSSIQVDRQDLTQRASGLGTGTAKVSGLTDSTATISTGASTTTVAVTASTTDSFSITVDGTDYSGAGTGSGSATDNASTIASELTTKLDNAGIENVSVEADGSNLKIVNASAQDVSYVQNDSSSSTGTASSNAQFQSLGGAADAEAGEGNAFQISLGDESFTYTARSGDTLGDVAASLNSKVALAGVENVDIATTTQSSNVGLNIQNTDPSGDDLDFGFKSRQDGVVGGGLELLDEIDVTSKAGREAALTEVEGLIQTGIDAAASFGSSQNRIEIQSDFVGNLMDSLESGIGSLVDANMEEASARLQALQVQQQLGTQSLSIANQAPQSVLSLFRG